MTQEKKQSGARKVKTPAGVGTITGYQGSLVWVQTGTLHCLWHIDSLRAVDENDE